MMTASAQELRRAGLKFDCFGLHVNAQETTSTTPSCTPNKPLSSPITVLWHDIDVTVETSYSLRGTNSKLFWEAYKSNNGSKISRLRETTARVNAFQTTLRDSECNDIIYTDYKTYLKRVDSCEPKIPHCVKNHRHSRLPYLPVYNAHPIFQDNFPKIK